RCRRLRRCLDGRMRFGVPGNGRGQRRTGAVAPAIGGRPMLMLGVLLLLSGIHLMCTGVLAEFVVRNQSNQSTMRTYVIRQVIEGGKFAPPAKP
ncbi:MAG: hypothetical protein EBW05_09545, partial [Betaproteobacteria bacterium]|nr:hypothetical protein [Betaproteobacteria bacterium]